MDEHIKSLLIKIETICEEIKQVANSFIENNRDKERIVINQENIQKAHGILLYLTYLQEAKIDMINVLEGKSTWNETFLQNVQIANSIMERYVNNIQEVNAEIASSIELLKLTIKTNKDIVSMLASSTEINFI